jgi:hypothetical protein
LLIEEVNLLSVFISDDFSVGVIEDSHASKVFNKDFFIVLSYGLFLVVLDFDILHWLCLPLEDLLCAEQQ